MAAVPHVAGPRSRHTGLGQAREGGYKRKQTRDHEPGDRQASLPDHEECRLPILSLPAALVAFVALEHLGFLVLEMFLWRGPVGQRIFAMSAADAALTAPLAANQGLYNGFLAAGLLWSLWLGNTPMARDVATFFLACCLVAGIFGGFTAKWTIWIVQGVPAAIALAVVRWLV